VSRKLKWAIAIVIVAVLAVPLGTYAYIHWLSDDAPERLALDTAADEPEESSESSVAPAGGLDGTWVPHESSSQVGYRVNEVLFGQRKEAVGRTSDVTGSMVISGTTVSKVELSADMTTVSSNEDRRDRQFQGRIMDTSRFPTATFSLTSPITLPSADATTVSVDVTGELTVHGTTKTVTFPLAARRTGGTIEVQGAIPIVFADYGIPNPSFGPVTTEDHGELEFLVAFTKSG
jgi:polyisoprenoid-binding protein YceI